jgi:hypothetical protein
MSFLQTMTPGWIYEVVVTTIRPCGFSAAPFGIWTDDGSTLRAALFKGASSLRSILEQRRFIVNFVDDPLILHRALHHRDTLDFETLADGPAGGMPVLAGVGSWVAAGLVGQEDQGKTILLEAQILAEGGRPPVFINRARGLFLESLVLSTRRQLLGRAAEDQLLENARVIAKVAPGSPYEQAMNELLALAPDEK